jgi:hypothetical protein
MRISSLALLGAFGLLVVSASGCRIEAHTQSQFEDATQPAKTSVKDWNREAINIQNDGINPAGGTTGVEVKVSSTATKITVEAVFAAHADDDKKSEADQSIREAIQSLTIDESNGFRIKCGHGGAHGTSTVAGSGCKILRVTIPAGSDTQPLDLTVGNGAGTIRIGLADGGDAIPTVKNLLVDNNSFSNDVNIRVKTVKDATLVVTGEGSVQVALPADFSAGKVLFTVDATDTTKALARISSDFAGMTSGSSYPTAGATANAAASLNVTTKGSFDDDIIRIAKQ